MGLLAIISLALALRSVRAQSPKSAVPDAGPWEGTAQKVYAEGLRAENDGDWQAAFEAYQQAVVLSPNDRTIQAHAQLARSALAQQRTEQAEKQEVSGNASLARAMLQSAVELDPSYTVAQERLQQLSQIVPSSGPANDGSGATLEALPVIQPNTGTHDFDFTGPTRGAYTEIARQFGVIAAFDPELQDRQVRFRVSGVDFDTAMRLLAEQTTTFWFALDSRTFFVAADTANKRRDYDPEIKKTILLPASETNDEMTETMRMVRDIVGLRRTELDFKTHTITVRDTPQNVALAEAILKDVQQTPGEFLLEVDLLEVDRNAELNLGITPPTTANTFSLSSGVVSQLQQAQSSGTLLQALENIFGSQNPLASSSGAAAAIPPLIAFGGGYTTFLATLPGASATAARTLSMVQSAERVLLRVQDGRPATFFVGEHYPITLSLLSASLVTPSSQLSTTSIASIAGALGTSATFPRTDYPVGHAPTGIAVADYNLDGNPDMAVTNEGDSTVSILLGTGQGTFQAQTTFATGTGPSAIVTADFNEDGKPDLAVANFTDNSISIFLGNGNGTFTAAPTITGVNSPVALLSTDFNGDGKPDLAVLDQNDGTVLIFLGNGDGTFGTITTTSVGQGPSALVTADFNLDGKPDLAVTNSGSNTVTVLLGNGDGTFFEKINFATGNSPSAIATADFNQDGKPDLAVTNKADNTFSIFLGNGDGTFGTATNFTTDAGPTALVEGDFTSGGFPDLLVVCESASTLDVFVGVGNTAFAAPISVATGTAPVAAASGSFTDTSVPDVAVVNQSSDTVSVFLNPTTSTTSSTGSLTPYPGSQYVDLGLKVHATPRVHPQGEVTLNMQFDITALSGTSVNGIPIISNRTIEQEVRLRDNETSILSGMIETSEIRSISGWPGLSFLGPLTGDHDTQQATTELVIAITPRQLRFAPHEDHSFYAGRGVGTTAPPEPAPGPQPAGGPPPGVPPGAVPPGMPTPGGLIPGAPGAPAPTPAPGQTPGNAAPETPPSNAPSPSGDAGAPAGPPQANNPRPDR